MPLRCLWRLGGSVVVRTCVLLSCLDALTPRRPAARLRQDWRYAVSRRQTPACLPACLCVSVSVSVSVSYASLVPSLAMSIHPLHTWPSICPGPLLPRIRCVPAYLSLALLLNHAPISSAYKSKQVEDGHSGICSSVGDEGRREGPCLTSGRGLPTGRAGDDEYVLWPILYTPHA